MSELALAGIVVALAVVIAAFFGLRGMRPRDSVRREDEQQVPQEPKFGDDESREKRTVSLGGDAHKAGADGKLQNAEVGVGGSGSAPVQGELTMPSYSPPKLPDPSEELIPLDICHSVRLHCRADAEGEWLRGSDMASLRAGLRECGMPVFRFLACGDDGEWRAVRDEGKDSEVRFRHWLVALPLADRGGAITEAKIKAVERETRRFAELRNLHSVFPSVGLSLENARLVDEFCGRVDIEVVLHADGTARPSRGSVEKMLRLQGLESDGGEGNGGGLIWRKDGEVRYGAHLRKSSGSPGDVSCAVFRLDVPNVSDPARAFEEMLECAQKVARVFFFQVRDPEGNEIGEERARELRMLTLGIAEEMRKYGVPPGGDVARLLFS